MYAQIDELLMKASKRLHIALVATNVNRTAYVYSARKTQFNPKRIVSDFKTTHILTLQEKLSSTQNG